MSISSRGFVLLRRQYHSVLKHLRRNDTAASQRPSANMVETLEPRLMLSGTLYMVNSLSDAIADDGVVTLPEAVMAANTNSAATADVAAGSAAEPDKILFDLTALSAEAGVNLGEMLTVNLTDDWPLEITDDLEISGPGSELLSIASDSQGYTVFADGCELIFTGISLPSGGIHSKDGELTISDSVITLEDGEAAGIYGFGSDVTATDVQIKGAADIPVRGISLVYGNLKLLRGDISYCNGISNVSGGGISVGRGDAVIVDSIVSYCTSEGGGGGIYASDGLRVMNSIIYNCTSRSSGGGISGGNESLIICDSEIYDNVALQGNGGGIAVASSDYLVIADSMISGNVAYQHGGGIACNGNVTISGCLISDNSLTASNGFSGYGGGIACGGLIGIDHCEILNNYAGHGGAIDVVQDSDIVIDASVISGNTALIEGSAIRSVSLGQLVLTSTAISCNSGGGNGAIIDAMGACNISNCTIVSNYSDKGQNIIDISSCISAIIANNIIAFNEGPREVTFDFNHYLYPPEIFNNIIGIDPGFVRMPSAGADGQWGTDDDDYGDLHLLDTSIAIDNGSDDVSVGDWDADSLSRKHNGVIDIGAYEYQSEAAAGREMSTVVTTLEDVVDSSDGQISLREAIAWASLNGETVTFAADLSGGTIVLDSGAIELYQSVDIDASSAGGITIDADNQSINIFYISMSDVSLTGLTLTGASQQVYTASWGNAISSYCSNVVVDRCIITGNGSKENVASSGGAIQSSFGSLEIIQSLIFGNRAYRYGAVCTSHADLCITNSTIVCNEADGAVGGVFFSDYLGNSFELNNSIVALNHAESYSDINVSTTINMAGSLIGEDPLFVRNPSAGADGVWGTADDDWGDLRLRPDSPAREIGKNSLAVDADGNTLVTDFGGLDRIVRHSVDAGAYEYQELMGDANGDNVVDLDDFILLKQNYGLSDTTAAQGNFNGDAAVDLDDFILLKQNYGNAVVPAAATGSGDYDILAASGSGQSVAPAAAAAPAALLKSDAMVDTGSAADDYVDILLAQHLPGVDVDIDELDFDSIFSPLAKAAI